jgi:streptogramin lyase
VVPTPTAAPPQPGFEYQTSFWVRQSYSKDVLLKVSPQIAWHVPAGFVFNKTFVLATFDGTTGKQLVLETTPAIKDRVVTFPATELQHCSFGYCQGGDHLNPKHVYWWEFIAIPLLPTAPISVYDFHIANAAETIGITPGPGPALWFSEDNLHIGRLSLSGHLDQFALPPSSCVDASGITAGPDGNVWFADSNCRSAIGKVTPGGIVREYQISSNPRSYPQGITAGPDGNLWFTEPYVSKIGRITTDGSIKEFSIPLEAGSIVTGPDGALWFTGSYRGRPGVIARMTTAGAITNQFHIPGLVSGPSALTVGPDKSLWFAGYDTCCAFGNDLYGIGKLTMAGKLTHYIISPLRLHEITTVAAGPDGTVWFGGRETLGHITTSGSIVEFRSRGHALVYVASLSPGPKGDPHMWFTTTEPSIGRVGI